MDKNKILSSDILDIIFDGRNKDYGAYDLRKTYNKRIKIALMGTGVICILVFTGYVFAGMGGPNKKQKMLVQDIQLENVREEKKMEPPTIPPPKLEPPKVEMSKYTPPKIVIDEKVKEEERPPDQEKLEDTKIGTINQQGIKDEGLTAPPIADAGKGVVEAPKEDYEKTFTKVEIQSEYPGGMAAWQRYLLKNLQYPEQAVSSEIQGDVIVQFIVDKEGNVSDVESISGPNELRTEAIRVIKKSGKWIPAIQNGRQVKSYKQQLIKFRIPTE